jgi:archaellum component FlaC
MQQERTSWNDERLDDLVSEIRALRNSINERFDKIDGRFDKVDDRFDKVDDRFETQTARFEKRFDNLTFGLIYAMASFLAAFGAVVLGG